MFSLANPIVQTAIVPLLVSLAGTGLIRLIGGPDWGRKVAALAIALGVLAAYGVTFGIPDFPPAGANRKMFYILVLAAVVGLVVDLARLPSPAVRVVAALAGVAAILWIGGERALGELWPTGVIVLVLLGVTREVTLDATFNGTGSYPWDDTVEIVGYFATTSIDRNDFGMTYGAGSVGDIEEIDLQVEAQRPKQGEANKHFMG